MGFARPPRQPLTRRMRQTSDGGRQVLAHQRMVVVIPAFDRVSGVWPTRRHRRTVAAIAVAVGMVFVSGCSSDERAGSYAYGVTASDLTGDWESAGVLTTVLSLQADGSFEGRSWRTYFTCPSSTNRDITDIASDPSTDVSGTWTVNQGDPSSFLPSVTLTVTDSPCSPGTVLSFVWRSAGGAFSVCFPTGRVIDPDNFTSNRTLILERADHDEESGRSCFS